MSYSVDPVADSISYWSPRYAAADRYERALADATHDLFVLLVGIGTQTRKWTWPESQERACTHYPTAMSEFVDAMDSPAQDFQARVLDILAAAARGDKVQTDANRLLRDIAAEQARFAVDQMDFMGD